MRKNVLSMGILAAAMTAVSLTADAKPAKPGLLTVSQPDGTQLAVRLAGDEFFHQLFTEDGYPLTQVGGEFFYSDITADGVVSSGILAGEPATRSTAAKAFLANIDKSTLGARISALAMKAPRRVMAEQIRDQRLQTRAANGEQFTEPPYERGYGLFPGTPFPAYGRQKALVFLVEYTDVKFRDSYEVNALDYFTRMLNEEGFNTNGGTGSASDYFRVNSGNTFLPEFDVYGPVPLAHNKAYYGANVSGNDARPEQMVKEACDYYKDIIDFSEYDADNNGLIDNVFVFYAGTGESSSGIDSDVWPHSWTMSSAGVSASELMYNGVRLENYTCSYEWEAPYGTDKTGHPDGVGTFIHEFSHTMGLPDLYSTDYYSSSFTPGEWSVMDYGPYNNSGRTPPLYSAFERYALGWIKPREVKAEAVSATLPVISENICAIIPTSKDTEFYLFENRQQEGWDKYIPGHGMLAWHIDYEASIWRRNVVNNTSYHQYVDLIEADNKKNESSRAGDAFPGTMKVREFSASTTPRLATWAGTNIELPITEIHETDGVITFNVLGGSDKCIERPVVNQPTDIDVQGFRLNWIPMEGCEAVVNVYTRADQPADGENNDDNNDETEGGTQIPGESSRRASLYDTTVNYVMGYHNRNIGEVSEVVIGGLEADTKYYYTVSMVDGLIESPLSEEGSVKTEVSAGMDLTLTQGSDSIRVEIADGLLTVGCDDPFVVYDFAGSVVARGQGSTKLPGNGLYVVSVPSRSFAKKVVL